MKLIAIAPKGKEYLHSKTQAFYAPNASADKICKILNDTKFRLKNENEVWHVYDYDFTMNYYVNGRFSIYKGAVRLRSL